MYEIAPVRPKWEEQLGERGGTVCMLQRSFAGAISSQYRGEIETLTRSKALMTCSTHLFVSKFFASDTVSCKRMKCPGPPS